MSDPIILKDKQPSNPDPTRIGISYSGGGPLVAIELGIARAFVQKGIVPFAIAGASAGALAGAAHALDPVTGKGIDVAQGVLSHMSDSLLGLDPLHVVGKVITEREHFSSLGDNSSIGPRIEDAIKAAMGLDNLTIGSFVPPDHPFLIIAGTDMTTGKAIWFPDPSTLSDALIASSAIPGVFPWRQMTIDGETRYVSDGGVVENQPLSTLLETFGCATLYACAVGATKPLLPPANALDNALRSSSFSMHQATKLEEDYVRLKLAATDGAVVHHIHPEVQQPPTNFNFSPESVTNLVSQAQTLTLAWLEQSHPD